MRLHLLQLDYLIRLSVSAIQDERKNETTEKMQQRERLFQRLSLAHYLSHCIHFCFFVHFFSLNFTCVCVCAVPVCVCVCTLVDEAEWCGEREPVDRKEGSGGRGQKSSRTSAMSHVLLLMRGRERRRRREEEEEEEKGCNFGVEHRWVSFAFFFFSLPASLTLIRQSLLQNW